MRVPDPVVRATRAVEHEHRLDAAASLLDAAGAPLSSGEIGAVLRGDWVGHASHPLLTDLPLGCWLGAGLLDVVGGKRARPAARRLVALGLACAPPTVAAGLVDAREIHDPRARRVAAVHALGNSAVAYLYWRSWRSRAGGRHARGVLFGMAGGALAWYTGYLGGHLSFGRGVGRGLRGMDDRDELGPPDDIVDIDEAARLLDVTPQEVRRLVEGELLVSVGDGSRGPRFLRSEVRAVRLVGA